MTSTSTCPAPRTSRANTARLRAASRRGYDVTEVFGEVRIPILADKPFAEMLAIEGAVRYSDYSNFGAATTWRVGAEWGPDGRAAFPQRLQRGHPRAGHLRAVRADRRRLLARQRSVRGGPKSVTGAEGFLRAAGRSGRGDQHLRPDRARLQPASGGNPDCARKHPRPSRSAPSCACRSSTASMSRSTTSRSKSTTRSRR